jgi:hypothetical protein
MREDIGLKVMGQTIQIDGPDLESCQMEFRRAFIGSFAAHSGTATRRPRKPQVCPAVPSK